MRMRDDGAVLYNNEALPPACAPAASSPTVRRPPTSRTRSRSCDANVSRWASAGAGRQSVGVMSCCLRYSCVMYERRDFVHIAVVLMCRETTRQNRITPHVQYLTSTASFDWDAEGGLSLEVDSRL